MRDKERLAGRDSWQLRQGHRTALTRKTFPAGKIDLTFDTGQTETRSFWKVVLQPCDCGGGEAICPTWQWLRINSIPWNLRMDA